MQPTMPTQAPDPTAPPVVVDEVDTIEVEAVYPDAPPADPLAEMRAATSTNALSDAAYIALILLRAAGHDVSAYTHAGGRWVVWCRAQPAQESRFSPVEWDWFYRAYLASVAQDGVTLRMRYEAVCAHLGRLYANGQLVPPEVRTGMRASRTASEVAG